MMKTSMLILVASIGLFTASDTIRAENVLPLLTKDISDSTYSLEESIQKAVLVDRTISQVGHRFFKAFSQQWDLPDNTMNRIVTVYEQPTAQGSLIWIHWNYKQVFQTRLSFREDMKNKIELASLIVDNAIQQAQNSGYSTSQDLAADEF